tara:strand:+ start:481 stop:1215 length:735 start_codon:yes stop_codon:yes gene_type:complete
MYIPTTFYNTQTGSYRLAKYEINLDGSDSKIRYISPAGRLLESDPLNDQSPYYLGEIYIIAILDSVEIIYGGAVITKIEDINYPISAYNDGYSFGPEINPIGWAYQFASSTPDSGKINRASVGGGGSGGTSGCRFRDTTYFFEAPGVPFTNYIETEGSECVTFDGPIVPYPGEPPGGCYLYEFYLPSTGSFETASYIDCVTGLAVTTSISETSYFCVESGSVVGLSGVDASIKVLGLSGCSSSI